MALLSVGVKQLLRHDTARYGSLLIVLTVADDAVVYAGICQCLKTVEPIDGTVTLLHSKLCSTILLETAAFD
jgi:hypothetical protein